MDFIEYDYDSQKDLKKKKHVEKQQSIVASYLRKASLIQFDPIGLDEIRSLF